jgi:hypothetical protein
VTAGARVPGHFEGDVAVVARRALRFARPRQGIRGTRARQPVAGFTPAWVGAMPKSGPHRPAVGTGGARWGAGRRRLVAGVAVAHRWRAPVVLMTVAANARAVIGPGQAVVALAAVATSTPGLGHSVAQVLAMGKADCKLRLLGRGSLGVQWAPRLGADVAGAAGSRGLRRKVGGVTAVVGTRDVPGRPRPGLVVAIELMAAGTRQIDAAVAVARVRVRSLDGRVSGLAHLRPVAAPALGRAHRKRALAVMAGSTRRLVRGPQAAGRARHIAMANRRARTGPSLRSVRRVPGVREGLGHRISAAAQAGAGAGVVTALVAAAALGDGRLHAAGRRAVAADAAFVRPGAARCRPSVAPQAVVGLRPDVAGVGQGEDKVGLEGGVVRKCGQLPGPAGGGRGERLGQVAGGAQRRPRRVGRSGIRGVPAPGQRRGRGSMAGGKTGAVARGSGDAAPAIGWVARAAGRVGLAGCDHGGPVTVVVKPRARGGDHSCGNDQRAAQNQPSPSRRRVLVPRISGARASGANVASYSKRTCRRLPAQALRLNRPPARESSCTSVRSGLGCR